MSSFIPDITPEKITNKTKNAQLFDDFEEEFGINTNSSNKQTSFKEK